MLPTSLPSLTLTVAVALAGVASLWGPSAQAAQAYSETWNDGSLAGWSAGTTSSAVSNPGDYLEVSRLDTQFGTSALTTLPAATGDFSGSAWTVSVDLSRLLTPEERLLEAIFGAKTQENIKQALLFTQQNRGKLLYAEAEPSAEELHNRSVAH